MASTWYRVLRQFCVKWLNESSLLVLQWGSKLSPYCKLWSLPFEGVVNLVPSWQRVSAYSQHSTLTIIVTARDNTYDSLTDDISLSTCLFNSWLVLSIVCLCNKWVVYKFTTVLNPTIQTASYQKRTSRSLCSVSKSSLTSETKLLQMKPNC